MRFFPSTLKGLVTTPTTRAECSLATSATMGAAPVPGAAAHAGGDEHHVRALEGLLDLVAVLVRRLACPRPGSAPAPSPRVSLRPDLDLDRREAVPELLRVGVHDDELDALHAGGDHPVDRVASRRRRLPTTLMTVVKGFSSSSLNMSVPLQYYVSLRYISSHPRLNNIRFPCEGEVSYPRHRIYRYSSSHFLSLPKTFPPFPERA